MASALPMFFVVAAGLCLSLVLLAFWQSLRLVLLDRNHVPAPRKPRNAARQALLREKQDLLNAIRDVRSEHELGKLSDGDREQFEQRYRARAREVLRELDEQIAAYRDRARSLLEEAIATASSPSSASASPAATTRASCPQCAVSNDGDAVFCKKCGTRLRVEASS
jgi:hypothetical protein